VLISSGGEGFVRMQAYRALEEGLRLAEMAYLSEGQIPEEVGHGAVL